MNWITERNATYSSPSLPWKTHIYTLLFSYIKTSYTFLGRLVRYACHPFDVNCDQNDDDQRRSGVAVRRRPSSRSGRHAVVQCVFRVSKPRFCTCMSWLNQRPLSLLRLRQLSLSSGWYHRLLFYLCFIKFFFDFLIIKLHLYDPWVLMQSDICRLNFVFCENWWWVCSIYEPDN